MDTDYDAAWRNKRAKYLEDPAFYDDADKWTGSNYNKIADDPDIGKQATLGLKKEYPLAECRSSDVAARYLAALVPREAGVDITGLAKSIVGDQLGAPLINVYQDNDPAHSENASKASLDIYKDWVCPFVQLSSDGRTLTVGSPKRNAKGQTVGITPTGTMTLDWP